MPYAPEHKQETRERIVKCARRLFNRKGFAEVTIDEIMANTGLTRGGFYKHFNAKEELYADAIRQFPIGRNKAVVDFGWMTLSGRFAWLLCAFAHIYFLIGFRSRIVVAFDWLWAYVTFRRGARIILAETGGTMTEPQRLSAACSPIHPEG
jgi:hypothetical protein